MPADLHEVLTRAAGSPGPWDVGDVRRRVVRRRVSRAVAITACLVLLLPLGLAGANSLQRTDRVELLDGPTAPAVHGVVTGEVGGHPFTVTALRDEDGFLDLRVEVDERRSTIHDLTGEPIEEIEPYAISTGSGIVALGLAAGDIVEVRLRLGDGRLLTVRPVPLTGELSLYAVAVAGVYDLDEWTEVHNDGREERHEVPGLAGDARDGYTARGTIGAFGPHSQEDDYSHGNARDYTMPLAADRFVQIADGVADGVPGTLVNGAVSEYLDDVEWWVEAAVSDSGAVRFTGVISYGEGATSSGLYDPLDPSQVPVLALSSAAGGPQAPLILAVTGPEVTEVRLERGGRTIALAINGRDAGLGAGLAAALVPGSGEVRATAYDAQGRELARQELQM